MERYFINVPRAKYEKKTDPIEVFINLVGIGLESKALYLPILRLPSFIFKIRILFNFITLYPN